MAEENKGDKGGEKDREKENKNKNKKDNTSVMKKH